MYRSSYKCSSKSLDQIYTFTHKMGYFSMTVEEVCLTYVTAYVIVCDTEFQQSELCQ